MENNKRLPYILDAIAIVLCIVGTFIIVNSYCIYNTASQKTAFTSYNLIQQGYAQALSYFNLALGVILVNLLLPRLQSITLPGGISLTLQAIQQNVASIIKQQNTIQAASVGEGGLGLARIQDVGDNTVDEDTEKGKWGKKEKNNGREIDSIIESTNNVNQIIITVESTDDKKPLQGIVKFHLPKSFNNPNPVIAVQDGKAVLTLKKAHGLFTIGAEADDGQTKLELDLAKNKSTIVVPSLSF